MVNNTNVVTVSRYARKPENSPNNHFRGKPYGLVGVSLDPATTELRFGYSLCHKDDQFNRNLARAIVADNIRTGIRPPDGSEPVFLSAFITNPESIAKAINSLPVTLRKTAVQVVTSLLRRWYIPSIDYKHAADAKVNTRLVPEIAVAK